MTDFTQLFDSYSRKARLYPALLTLLPAIAVMFSVWPLMGTSTAASAVMTLAVSFGLLFLLAELARSSGKRIEPKLLQQWGGWPTTLWLRHSTGHLSKTTRARYHAFLSGAVANVVMPTDIEEAANPAEADERYASAAQWLKERARSGASLVDRENASYGFRRNLLGLKPIAVLIALASLAAEACYIWRAGGKNSHTFGEVLANATAPQVSALIFAAAMLLVWLIVVRPQWVREAGDAYAGALLATCDV